MLETIREYGLEVLASNGELEAARLAHAQYYLVQAEEAEVHMFVQRQQLWFDQLEREHDNLQAALRWSVERWGRRSEEGNRLAVGRSTPVVLGRVRLYP